MYPKRLRYYEKSDMLAMFSGNINWGIAVG